MDKVKYVDKKNSIWKLMFNHDLSLPECFYSFVSSFVYSLAHLLDCIGRNNCDLLLVFDKDLSVMFYLEGVSVAKVSGSICWQVLQ